MVTKEQIDLMTQELRQASDVLREALKVNPNDNNAVETYKNKMNEIRNKYATKPQNPK